MPQIKNHHKHRHCHTLNLQHHQWTSSHRRRCWRSQRRRREQCQRWRHSPLPTRLQRKRRRRSKRTRIRTRMSTRTRKQIRTRQIARRYIINSIRISSKYETAWEKTTREGAEGEVLVRTVVHGEPYVLGSPGEEGDSLEDGEDTEDDGSGPQGAAWGSRVSREIVLFELTAAEAGDGAHFDADSV